MQRDVSPSIDVPTKRRKVRKGTKNCWECKRRKVSCIFSEPTNTACDNCIRRKATCIGQEYVAEFETFSNRPVEVEARLGRVEELLERLITNSSEATAPVYHDHESPAPSSSGPLLTPSSLSQSSRAHPADAYTGVARDLVAAWPTQKDLDRIYELPYGLATHLHMTRCAEGFDLRNREPAPQEIIQLPSPNSHPVLIAHKILCLASLLQGALSVTHLLDPDCAHFRGVMSCAFDRAIRLVTTNDELTGSVEGLQCIMIEAMIHNNAGNLHRAWLAMHRAATVAQILGLHRGPKATSLKFLEEGTKAAFDADEFCFVIMSMDRYLSIMLGLPRSSFDSRALSLEALARCNPLERMARKHCIIVDQILKQRERNTSTQIMEVNEIEQLLQDAAAEMPPQWWLVPDFEPNQLDKADAPKAIGRVNYQFAHHILSIQAHLPFLLRSPLDSAYDHSKLMAADISRDILQLFIAFRKWNAGLYYCRSVDYFIFVAITTLCVAHISARSNKTACSSGNSSVERSLSQNHIRDRGLMECAHQVFQKMKDDCIAVKISHIMQHILDVEAEATNGVEFCTTAIASEIAADGGDGKYVDGNKSYQLRMPFFGVINLQRKQSSDIASMVGQPDDAQTEESSHMPFQAGDDVWTQQQSWPAAEERTLFSSDFLDIDNWTLQSVNDSLFDSLFGGMGDQNGMFGVEDQQGASTYPHGA